MDIADPEMDPETLQQFEALSRSIFSPNRADASKAESLISGFFKDISYIAQDQYILEHSSCPEALLIATQRSVLAFTASIPSYSFS